MSGKEAGAKPSRDCDDLLKLKVDVRFFQVEKAKHGVQGVARELTLHVAKVYNSHTHTYIYIYNLLNFDRAVTCKPFLLVFGAYSYFGILSSTMQLSGKPNHPDSQELLLRQAL